MTGLVSLPMYAAPRDALDAFWSAVRDRLIVAGVDDVPESRSEPDDLDAHWRSSDLLLSQTCGRPFATTLRGVVTLVATPHYDAPGCDGPLYRSLFVVRRDDPAGTFADLRGRRAAYNERRSHSGFSQLFAEAAAFDHDGPFFGEAFACGAHARSLAAVAENRADVAAIDCVTYALAQRDRPETVENLRVLGLSPPAPSLPFVTSGRRSAEEIAALRTALADVAAASVFGAVRDGLRLTSVSMPPASDYDVCRTRAALADEAYARIPG